MNKNKIIAVYDYDSKELFIMDFNELKDTILSLLDLYKSHENNQEHINIIEKIEFIEDLKLYYEQNLEELTEYFELKLSEIYDGVLNG